MNTTRNISTVRDTHVRAAIAKLNEMKGATDSTTAGHLQYADIKGDGVYRPKVYCVLSGGGVTYSSLTGRTKRETLANVYAAMADQQIMQLRDALRAVVGHARQFVDDWAIDVESNDAEAVKSHADAERDVTAAEKLIEA